MTEPLRKLAGNSKQLHTSEVIFRLLSKYQPATEDEKSDVHERVANATSSSTATDCVMNITRFRADVELLRALEVQLPLPSKLWRSVSALCTLKVS